MGRFEDQGIRCHVAYVRSELVDDEARQWYGTSTGTRLRGTEHLAHSQPSVCAEQDERPVPRVDLVGESGHSFGVEESHLVALDLGQRNALTR